MKLFLHIIHSINIEMTAFDEFRKVRGIQLKEQFPYYRGRTIQQMISDEWKQQKGAGASISARESTLRYQANVTLARRVPQYDVSNSKEIYNIVKCKSCSYCDKKLKRKSTGDHFMPVVANSKKPILSNFSSLTIPCCQECNSSKANKSWREFAKMLVINDEKMQKLEFLEDFIASRIKYYRVDQAEYDKIICDIRESLERIRHACETIPILEIDEP
jgi:hypothetical protein